MSILKFNSAPLGQSQKVIRGLREASIPVADANAVIGVQRIQFTDKYQFGLFASPEVDSPAQLGSLIHAGISSRGIMQAGHASGRAAYFGASATDSTSEDDETVVSLDSPPDVAGQPVQVPLFGANKLACSLWVQSSSPNFDTFTLSLYRCVTPIDATTYMGSPANFSMLVAQWGPVFGALADDNHPVFSFTGFELPVGTSFYLELKNNNNAGNLNILAGSIFFHG